MTARDEQQTATGEAGNPTTAARSRGEGAASEPAVGAPQRAVTRDWTEVDTSTDDPADARQAAVTPTRTGAAQAAKEDRSGAPRPPSAERKAPAKPAAREGSARPYRLLSALLKDLPEDELRWVLRAYPQALERGLIRALEVTDRPAFSVQVLNEQGERETLELPEELVLAGDGWLKWLADQRRRARFALRVQRGDSRAKVTALQSGEEDFERLFEIRRQALRAARSGLGAAGNDPA